MKASKQIVFLVVFFSMVTALTAASQTALAHHQTDGNQFYLVSFGAGDADLITLGAINTIKASDVIVCRDRTKEEFAEYLQGKTILIKQISIRKMKRRSQMHFKNFRKDTKVLHSALDPANNMSYQGRTPCLSHT